MRENDDHLDKQTEVRHLLRTVKTSLELAIVARAPTELLDRLGRVSGLLDAVSQLPVADGPAQAMTAGLIAEGFAAVGAWDNWHRGRTPSA
jgi:hypothetical protein